MLQYLCDGVELAIRHIRIVLHAALAVLEGYDGVLFVVVVEADRGFVWPVAGTLAAIILFSYHYTHTQSAFNKFDERVFPVAAVNWLTSHPQSGNMFNEFNWGGYLLYRLWPEQLVFMDSQTDFYGEALTREYEQLVSTSKGWKDVFEKYNIEWIIIPSNSTLAQTLESEYHWQVLYQDNTAVILRK